MKVFIGSSREQLDNARKVAVWLENYNYTPILWNRPGVFLLGDITIEALEKISKDVDAAIFIFGADDKTWYRETKHATVRDNVLLEYGLFSGVLSRKRVAIITSGQPWIATDLAGVTYVDISKEYTAQEELRKWMASIAIENIRTTDIEDTGLFKVVSLFDAFKIALNEAKEIEDLRVFAISTYKSVQLLRLMADLRIRNAYVLLRTFLNNEDPYYTASMQTAIDAAVLSWHKMAEIKAIANLHLSYFDYHPDEGTYIIDNRYWFHGALYYDFNLKSYDFSNKVMLVDDKTTIGRQWINHQIEFFDYTYNSYRKNEEIIK